MTDVVPRPGASADSLARLHTAEAIGALVEVVRNKGAKDSDRVSAANSILDRGHGKATQAIIAVPTRRAIAEKLASMDDSALLAIAAAARIARGESPPADRPSLALPPGRKPDDITDAEWIEVNPVPIPQGDSLAATPEEFPSAPALPGNPWD